MAAALAVERADEVGIVVWLGDGARENWTLASELCPLALQVLDVPHAAHWAMLCGKAMLGEGDCLLPQWEARIHELLDADSPQAPERQALGMSSPFRSRHSSSDSPCAARRRAPPFQATSRGAEGANPVRTVTERDDFFELTSRLSRVTTWTSR